ncbi:DUF4129 domain-containing protein [Cognatilysobacter lacus]|uniref:DUF4129 domain-containing protein n=1 Tax=Cognatilysobacter lacus TaxID=1643323 RepID=A0A5D8YNF4_9GAMM|nr:DUF4129 domain-containing protein [Lysobacter lacus]TZF84368.1 DUF4129 domain-containing protein [Lysobacter lacus]
MRIDALTVVLRPRSSWEAVELGTALVRRHARAVWRPWLACTVPAFAIANALAWLAGTPVLAMLAMWWLKPLFDRIPLFVLSRAVFGEVPTTRVTLRGAFAGSRRAMLGYLTWRRLSPARALLMPVDVLEGGAGRAVRERRRVLAGPAYGIAALCFTVFAAFETALVVGLAVLAFLFVPNEYLQDALRDAWQYIRDSPTWLQLLENALAWTAASVIEPFYVGSGFGQYLNRRTEIEGWDIELAFRRLRERLLAASSAMVLLAALLTMPWTLHAQTGHAFVPARPSADPSAGHAGTTPVPQGAGPSPVVAPTPLPTARQAMQTCKRPTPAGTDLPRIFGADYRDPAAFAKAVDRAYDDQRLHPRRKVTMWVLRHPERRPEQRDLPAWLRAFGRVLAAISEFGMWLLLAGLVLLLALTAKYWWPWLRGVASDVSRPAAPVVEGVVDDASAPLPDDIVATARRLWRDGQRRDALALVYRAAVESMLKTTGRVLPPGATEAQCLRAAQALPEAPRRAFARIVRLWQYAAWAEQMPPEAEFDAALDEAAMRFGWRA